MQSALITGISGFTGRYLAPLLAERGYRVHGTVHGEDGSNLEEIADLHAVDIGDDKALGALVDEVRPDKVIHLAAISFVAFADVAEMYRTNLVGTRNLLAALADCESKPSTVLLASTAIIYGNSSDPVLTEDHPIAPANDYGVSKAAMELLAATYRDRLPIVMVRPFNYTGRGQSPQFLIPKIVDHFRRRAATIELGNLDVARDFLDVRTVADAYARLLDEPTAIGRVFNVCSGLATSLDQIVQIASELSGHRLEIRVNPHFVRAGEVKSLRGSAERLESVIGPLTMPPLRTTLQWMLAD